MKEEFFELRCRPRGLGSRLIRRLEFLVWEIGVPYFGVLIIRTLLVRVLYSGPLFSETPVYRELQAKLSPPGGKLKGDAVLPPVLHVLVAWCSRECVRLRQPVKCRIVWAYSPFPMKIHGAVVESSKLDRSTHVIRHTYI